MSGLRPRGPSAGAGSHVGHFSSNHVSQKGRQSSGVPLVVRLRARFNSDDCNELFEEPLAAFLREEALGRITEPATAMIVRDEVTFIEFEVTLRQGATRGVERLAQALERLGAPVGSAILGRNGMVLHSFGVAEGLGIYLDGVGLPDAVYGETRLDEIALLIQGAMQGLGEYFGVRRMDERTALYFYGPSYRDMEAAIEAVVDAEPLCENAWIRRIA